MEIPKNLKDEIWDYCRVNDISNIDSFVLKLLKQGFTSEKYGSTPISNTVVEKIVEKIVEVPINTTDETLNKKYLMVLEENERLKKQIEELKKTSKKDIYGE